MSGLIVVGGQETASATSLLDGTLLASIPKNGILTFEVQNELADGTNSGTISIQLPDNSQPINGLLVPAGRIAIAGVIDADEALKLRFAITQGGTCVFAYTETGATIFTWRVAFKPFR